MANTQEYGGGTSTRLPPPPRPPKGTYDVTQNPPPQPPPPGPPPGSTAPQWMNIPGIPSGVVPAYPAYQNIPGIPPNTVPNQPWQWENLGGLNTPPTVPPTRQEKQLARWEAKSPAEQDATLREQHASTLQTQTPMRPRTYQMTWAEYNRLSDEQRNAVEWNTQLVRAVHKDKTSQDLYGQISPRAQSAYDQMLQKTFGSTDSGSKTYAPETLGLLQQIGYTDKSGDLDDFLGLRTGITTEDLQLIPESSGVGAVPLGSTNDMVSAITQRPAEQVLGATSLAALGPYGQVLDMQRSLAAKTGEMEATLARGNQMMATVGQTIEADRTDIVQQLGGLAFAMPNRMVGYAPPKYDPTTGEALDLNTAFRDTFDTLANPAYAKDHDKILAAFSSVVSPAEYDAFLSYANSRSATAATLGAPLGAVPGGHYISPHSFRVQMGLVKAARPQPDQAQPPPEQQKQEATY